MSNTGAGGKEDAEFILQEPEPAEGTVSRVVSVGFKTEILVFTII